MKAKSSKYKIKIWRLPMYKINQHFSNAVKKNGICLDKDLKYLKYEKLQKEPHGFYCKKWGNDFIIESNYPITYISLLIPVI